MGLQSGLLGTENGAAEWALTISIFAAVWALRISIFSYIYIYTPFAIYIYGRLREKGKERERAESSAIGC